MDLKYPITPDLPRSKRIVYTSGKRAHEYAESARLIAQMMERIGRLCPGYEVVHCFWIYSFEERFYGLTWDDQDHPINTERSLPAMVVEGDFRTWGSSGTSADMDDATDAWNKCFPETVRQLCDPYQVPSVNSDDPMFEAEILSALEKSKALER